MKVVHVLGGFYPDPMAGTEVYVEGLAFALQPCGVQSLITAAADRDHEYAHKGLRVRRFRMSPAVADIEEIYGAGDGVAQGSFEHLLREERPDIVHFHTKTRAASVHMLRSAKTLGAATVVTYHTPTMSCPRGTLLEYGRNVCDGVLEAHRCTKCVLMNRGLSETISELVCRMPSAVGRTAARTGLRNGIVTALRMKELITLHARTTRELYAEADRVVVLCNWAQDVLIRNGVPVEKLSLVRHGIDLPAGDAAYSENVEDRPSPRLKIAFVGRIEPIKGVDVMIEAMRGLDTNSISLDIYGVDSVASTAYRARVQDLILADARIRLLLPVPNDQIISTLRQYNVLCVPSQGLETGPLVVLEAFAAGIPVIGSNLGGVAELVNDGVDGVLLDPFAPEQWTEAFKHFVSDPGKLEHLRQGVQPPRTTDDVAREMSAIYEQVA